MSPVKPLFSIVVAICPRWLLSWIHCVMNVVWSALSWNGAGGVFRAGSGVGLKIACTPASPCAMSMMSRWMSLIERPTNCPRSVPSVSVPAGALAFSTEAISSLSCWMMFCTCRSLRLLICGTAALNICCTPMRSETIRLT